ncbi:MAG: ATP-binding cassette domain-containing protein [Gammaproteobacteria bacterium]|nr:ATP-binding cassette domain-containing protein [Gammaproteobacteria bacterium]
MTKLAVKDLTYHHCGPVNFEVDSGECISVSGASGSGKSLLLRSLADLDDHGGDVMLDKINMKDVPANEWRLKVALLPAESQWWFDTVGEHFSVVDHALLELFGFPDNVMSWSISRMSSGEKQRLALLRLLINQPDVLLLDEPTANLDKNNTLMFEQIIKQYLQQHKACVIWVSHDAKQLERMCQQHFEIKNGQLSRC